MMKAQLPVGAIVDDKYEILSILGQGGMGIVYLARHLRLEKDVALKVLYPNLMADRDAQEKRFLVEGQAMAQLQHKHIVAVSDLKISDDLFFLEMELIDGETLDAHIRQSGPLEVKRALHLLKQILEAIRAAHEHPIRILHRDLKPGNIMLTSADNVKVTDFGLAKMREGMNLTLDGASAGTMGYSAPEQFLSLKKADERSDIYALGMILYSMLLGSKPSYSTDDEGNIQSPSVLLPDLSQKICAVIDKAIQIDPVNRFQSIAEMQRALFAATPVSADAETILEESPSDNSEKVKLNSNTKQQKPSHGGEELVLPSVEEAVPLIKQRNLALILLIPVALLIFWFAIPNDPPDKPTETVLAQHADLPTFPPTVVEAMQIEHSNDLLKFLQQKRREGVLLVGNKSDMGNFIQDVYVVIFDTSRVHAILNSTEAGFVELKSGKELSNLSKYQADGIRTAWIKLYDAAK
ncbi:MAG: serine/threonine protein kinase [Calditrichia bacterium]